ncbi:hypothetical protein CEE37_06090 [candidate division LCP-89 bacterium B3_LCP]|uniref:diguanylate cyclase n=1 Tax=candidate division LCP-89 bacterium B3_LCP TaxID=2012998 RepID=A0A532V226_UNCL8|nr:MAG: hypothetical protein CEE37_06090 [candidate division LCP-89 bacterium B3_LCP]
MNAKKVEKICGSHCQRGRFTGDLLKTLAAEILGRIHWNDADSLLFLSAHRSDFGIFGQDIDVRSDRGESVLSIFKYSDRFIGMEWPDNSGLVLVAIDNHNTAFIFAERVETSASTVSVIEQPIFDTFFCIQPSVVKKVLHTIAGELKNPVHRKALLDALSSIAITKDAGSDATLEQWKFFGFNAAKNTDKSFRNSQTDLNWTRFGFELDEELGDFIAPEEMLQIFSDILKKYVAFDYLEITFLPNSSKVDPDPVNYVRNDTGFGGKLLSIILKEPFIKGLPRRKRPVTVNANKCESLINNPELLKVMELQRGILVPLIQNDSAGGVMKLFFQHKITYSPDMKAWLVKGAAILFRALSRTWRYRDAQKMATIDGLTGLYNHRYFMEQIQKEFTRARRYRNWLSLIIIDIDNFKEYNDINGHLMGDQALRKVALTIKKSVREIDLIARWGGEEFALLLPEINLQNGMIVAEKIRREVETQKFKNQRKQPLENLTISLGVAANTADMKSHQELFKRADLALYQAKRDGRNRCLPAK